jgi:hypothetical protein
VYPVHGRITFEGKPMAGGGAISFVPLADQRGKTAGGIIKEDGSYTLGTYAESDGSMPGDFRVIVMQQTVREPEPTKDGSAPVGAISTVMQADRIPLSYAGQESPLTTKVESKQNELNFDLKRQ